MDPLCNRLEQLLDRIKSPTLLNQHFYVQIPINLLLKVQSTFLIQIHYCKLNSMPPRGPMPRIPPGLL